MTRLKPIILYSLFFCFITVGLHAQNSPFTEGRISYQAVFPDSSEATTVSGYAFPREINLSLRNSLLLTEISSLYVTDLNFIDLSSRKSDSYLAVAGKKIAIRSNLDTMLSQAYDRTPYILESVPGQKTIAGHSCYKVIAHFTNKAIPDAVIFYTRDIPFLPVAETMAFSRVPGFIMEIAENFQGVTLHINVKKVEAMKLPPDYFEKPSGYTPVAATELFKTLGKPF